MIEELVVAFAAGFCSCGVLVFIRNRKKGHYVVADVVYTTGEEENK